MSARLLVTDIDGTLIPYNSHEIPQQTKEALIALQEKGIRLAVATGRVKQGITAFAKELRLDEFGGFVIANNGAQIMNYKTKEVLFQSVLPVDVVTTLCDMRTQLEVNCMLMQEEFAVMSGYDRAVQIDHDAIDIDFIWPHDVMTYADKPTYRVNYTSDIPNHLNEVEEYLKQQFGESLSIARSQSIFLDIMNRGVDKSFAMTSLANHLGIDIGDVVACGDGGNDLGMIRDAGIGVAMGNAVDEVKRVAKVIAPSVDEMGLLWVIQKYFD